MRTVVLSRTFEYFYLFYSPAAGTGLGHREPFRLVESPSRRALYSKTIPLPCSKPRPIWGIFTVYKKPEDVYKKPEET
jgi:hypothetical protein